MRQLHPSIWILPAVMALHLSFTTTLRLLPADEGGRFWLRVASLLEGLSG